MNQIQKPRHILVAAPCYGGMLHRGFFHSILNLQKITQIHDIHMTVHTIGNESLIQRGRNFYVNLCYSNPHFTHLMFIDSDITFNPENVIRMINFDKDVVCGIYPKKGLDMNKIRHLSRDDKILTEELEAISLDYVVNFDGESVTITNGFIPCMYAGTGFMMIKREVIEKLIQCYPETKYNNDVGGYNLPGMEDNFYALFDCFICPKSRRYLSEDYAFCQRCIEQGMQIWLDLTCNLTHTGTHDYKGSFGRHITFVNEIANKQNEEIRKQEDLKEV